MLRLGLRILGAAAIGAFVSCGSDDPDFDFVSNYMGGLWRGNLSLASNGCGFELRPSYNFVHSVMQVIDSIQLEDEEGRTFYGQVIGEDGFSVDAAGPSDLLIPDGRRCTFTYRYRYDSINDDDDPTAQVRYFIQGDCWDGTECESEYAGNGGRD